VNITADGFVFSFDRFVATVGPSVEVAEKRKFCTLTVELDFPEGFSFSVADVDFRGFADLGAGIVGTQRASYYFAGFPPGREPEFKTVLRGPTMTTTRAATRWSCRPPYGRRAAPSRRSSSGRPSISTAVV
jgi:hypothetical protein